MADQAGSVDGKELCSLTSVAERRTLLSLMDNFLQHLHSTLTSQRSMFSGRLLSQSWSAFGCLTAGLSVSYHAMLPQFSCFYCSYFSFFILISLCVSGYMSQNITGSHMKRWIWIWMSAQSPEILKDHNRPATVCSSCCSLTRGTGVPAAVPADYRSASFLRLCPSYWEFTVIQLQYNSEK